MSESDKVMYQLHEVFVRSGLPTITYVEPDNTIFLKLALEQPVHAVIVEGPPGSGKTVTVQQLISHSGIDAQHAPLYVQKFLNASIEKDLQEIRTLQMWHTKTVVIDSFHTLDVNLRQEIINYLRELVSETDTQKKLVIIGTPFVHETLIDVSHQIIEKLELYKFKNADNRIIHQLIEKGESALNVFFEEKEQIVQAVHGNLNLTQRLCYDLCALAHVTQTQEQTKSIPLNMKNATTQTMIYLDYKFARALKFLIGFGNTEDTTCLRLLEKIASTKDGVLSLPSLKANEPSFAYEIEHFINDCWMDKFYVKHPEAIHYLFFEKTSQNLIVGDVQLSFYLKHRELSILAQQVGKTPTRPKVFISYSHLDTDCMQRLMICLKPIERELMIDLWSDKKIEAGQFWRAEIEKALHGAKAAILLISAPFWASDFITKYELPVLLENAKARGVRIIPVILSSSDFDHTLFHEFQSINSPSQPLRGLGKAEWDWDGTFVKVTNLLREYFRVI